MQLKDCQPDINSSLHWK